MTQPNAPCPEFPWSAGKRECEVAHCGKRAMLRRLWVDSEGWWTWLCEAHFRRAMGWHD